MQCLRCGRCCQQSFVVIVVDPELGPVEENLKAFDLTKESCPHLGGDKPGEYSCAIHDEPWYDCTPCYAHTQIEGSDSPCRTGKYILGG